MIIYQNFSYISNLLTIFHKRRAVEVSKCRMLIYELMCQCDNVTYLKGVATSLTRPGAETRDTAISIAFTSEPVEEISKPLVLVLC